MSSNLKKRAIYAGVVLVIIVVIIIVVFVTMAHKRRADDASGSAPLTRPAPALHAPSANPSANPSDPSKITTIAECAAQNGTNFRTNKETGVHFCDGACTAKSFIPEYNRLQSGACN